MALGFGFNKQKVLAAAEKAVQQGKLQSAITEYEKVTKEDPKDLTVLNTIGDLYSRVGDSHKAAHYFKKVGDHYASDGFTVKAIAMYKKLVKLIPGETEAILKLAELYTQQGLYNDARQQYVLVADAYMKSNELDAAAKIFQKMLELDPENSTMQSRLADLYVKLGKKDEAKSIFFNAAQSLYAKGAFDAADEACNRVLHLDPANADALMLRGAIAADSGDGASAVKYLEQIPNVDSRPEALRALMRAHLLLNQPAQAEPIANKLLTVHNDINGLTSFAESLMSAGQLEKALAVYDQYADKLLAANPTGIITALHSSINKIKENAPALQILRSVYLKARDTTHLNEVSELLAHAYVQDGQLEKARDLYKELSDLEPENTLHAQNYKQILAKLGDSASRPLTAEESSQAFMVDELESTTAPQIEQQYAAETAAAIRNGLTESELFDSYNLPAKAIGPLEAVLPLAPEDAQVNQRLASLYARAERYAEAARCCEVLAKLHTTAGHDKEAKQFADMAAKYRDRAAAAPAKAAAPAPAAAPPAAPAPAAPAEFGFEVSAEAPAPAAETPAAPAEFGFEVSVPAAETTPAREVDLSNEWETMVASEPSAAPLAVDAGKEAADEARFYLGQSMFNEARGALEKLEQVAPGHPDLAGLRAELETAAAPAPAAPAASEPSVAEFVFDTAAIQATVEPEAAPEPPPPPPPPAKPAPKPEAPKPAAKPAPAPAAAAKDVLSDFVLDLESSLGDDFAIGGGKPTAAPPPPPPPPPPAAKPAPAKAAPPPPPPPPPPAAKPAAPAMSAAAAPAPAPETKIEGAEASNALSDMFAEFKEDVEETAGQAEDPDTHYNLGVAFKEMGLLDEAIGELQKVCQAIEHGHPFSQVMQAYTWLAHCLSEKGAPQAAVRWYEKALHVSNIDPESRLAVYYELASAHEAAGNKKEALSNFMEVYGSNIDYRDVAERIKALKA
ncbi:MAG TPA: tetratricopeptide repeat protein [Terriglobales bacterium]|nr:tetratricopeptide repeat protein [Terriglobales bacterium]